MTAESNGKLTPWSLVILVLSLYTLAILAAELIITISRETQELFTLIDNLICGIFLLDFGYRALRSRAYLKWGWIDLISSIPNFQFLRIGRLFRVIRVFRLLRVVRSTRQIGVMLLEYRKRSAFAASVLLVVLIMSVSSIAILHLETSPESNITNAQEAVWWTFVTITTVGYGDFYPVTFGGRLLAGFLMLFGIGLFGVFTGIAASFFMGSDQKG